MPRRPQVEFGGATPRDRQAIKATRTGGAVRRTGRLLTAGPVGRLGAPPWRFSVPKHDVNPSLEIYVKYPEQGILGGGFHVRRIIRGATRFCGGAARRSEALRELVFAVGFPVGGIFWRARVHGSGALMIQLHAQFTLRGRPRSAAGVPVDERQSSAGRIIKRCR